MGKKIGGYIMLVIGVIIGLAALSTMPTLGKNWGNDMVYNVSYLIGQLIGLTLVSALAAFLIIKGLKFIK